MNRTLLRLCCLSGGLLAGLQAHGQVTITGPDMFNRVGLSYSAYSNDYKPSDPAGDFAVDNRMGSKGGSQLWNFTTGPTNKIVQCDYVDPAGIPEAKAFAQAKIVERKSVDDTKEVSFLVFEQVPAIGRKVYGFYDVQFSADSPSNIFDPPIIDFPDPVNYKDTWTTRTTFTTAIVIAIPVPGVGEVPGTGEAVAAQLTVTRVFTADAWGVIDLPELGACDALRVNEEQTVSIAVDLTENGQYQHIMDEYARNYYWLRPGYGIVAQLNSLKSVSPPPENFERAAMFLRMFRTSIKLPCACPSASRVTDLKISISEGKALVKWTKAECATRYKVEFSSSPIGEWNLLGNPTTNSFMLDESAKLNPMRFYRTVVLP